MSTACSIDEAFYRDWIVRVGPVSIDLECRADNHAVCSGKRRFHCIGVDTTAHKYWNTNGISHSLHLIHIRPLARGRTSQDHRVGAHECRAASEVDDVKVAR